MKRKLIKTLAVTLLFSFTASINTFAVSNNIPEAESENTAVEYSSQSFNDVEKEIKEMAETIVDNTKLYKGYDAASVQYAIMDGDDIIVSDNFNGRSGTEDTPLTKDTMYGIGSVSKMYVTAAVMQLVDEKKVDLDLPLTNYIKDFKMADERYKKITPRMLINHSSGLYGSHYSNSVQFNDNDTYVHDNLLKELENEKLKAEPGEFSVYCNDGFTLAEILVERISGMSYTDYVKKHFSEPLGLKNTKTPLDNFEGSSIAKTYEFLKEGDPQINFMLLGAGGIYSNAEEVCKFIRGITRKDDRGVLSNRSVDLMAEKESLKGLWPTDAQDSAFNYGLGWDSVNLFPFNRYGIKALSKGGDVYNYHSAVITLPDYNITMAVTSAGGTSTVDEAFASAALLKVLQYKAEERGEEFKILPDVQWKEERSTSMPQDICNYSGVYNNGLYGKNINYKVNPDGTLSVVNNGVDYDTHLHYTNTLGYFMNDEGNSGMRFVKERNGKTYLEVKTYVSYPKLTQIADCEYYAQKLDENELKESMEEYEKHKEEWDNHLDEVYFVLNEKYSSIHYVPETGICIDKFFPDAFGFLSGDKIISDSEALPIVQIPGMMGRDLNNCKLYSKGGIDYAERGSSKYQGYNTIPYINENTKKLTIGEDRYTKWFKVPDYLDGAVITVNSSSKTSFNAYAANGEYINDSYLTGINSIVLSKGEVLGFAGDVGENFSIKIEKK